MEPYPFYAWYFPEDQNVMPVVQPMWTPVLQERPVRPGILKSSAGMPYPGRAQPTKTLRFQLEPTAIGKADYGAASVELTETSNEAWSTALSSTTTAEEESLKNSNASPPPTPSEGSVQSEYMTEVTDEQEDDSAERSLSSSSKSRGSESFEASSAKSSSISGRGSYLKTGGKKKGRKSLESVKKRASRWTLEDIREYLARHSWLGDVSLGGSSSGSSLPFSQSSGGDRSSLVEENAAQRDAWKRYAAFTLVAALLMLMVAAVTASVHWMPIPIDEESQSAAAAGPSILYDGVSDQEPSHDEIDGSPTMQPAGGHSRTAEDVTVLADGRYAIGDIPRSH
ncbi:hypothetical protein MTO96_005686 [Rhipicephalus appendiculatus]